MVNLDRAGLEIGAMVHDSMLVSVAEKEVRTRALQIRNIMEIKLGGVKMTVSVKIGKTWGDCR